MACCPRPTLDEITEWVADYEKHDYVAHATVHVLAQEDPSTRNRESWPSI